MGNKNVGALGGAPDPLQVASAPVMRAEPASDIADTVVGDRSNPRTKGANGNTTATAQSKSVLNWSVGIVVVALLILWLMGGIVFKNANL